MLRTSLRSARVLGGRSGATSATRQWPIAASQQAAFLGQRHYAVQSKPDSNAAKPAVPLTAQTITSPKPTIDDVKAATKVPPTPPPPPPPKKKGFFRRLRNFVYTLILLGAVGFAGGIWYSRVSDNFHDFFTQYVPFGEQAVLYLEEKEFKKKFPNAPRDASKARDTDAAVKIPAQSGASWRVADQSRRSSAGPTPKEPKPEEAPKPAAPKPAPVEAAPAPVKVVEKAPAAPAPQPEPAFKAPEVNEPSKILSTW
ncbi:hypothetical protein G7Z17_g13733 [Cylindrodendrum hubeiense]|uniref:MICOS complex subunit MIC60 n=1 Tax=Cylindrodendrum hubeiense TaxID=595255 RepID=A0A9P5GVW9_9HYPO|nr:hypothetical protein G7Z17_g13733 [Cylindrodendrum hubeiense]